MSGQPSHYLAHMGQNFGDDFPSEVGWFGSSIYKAAKSSVKSVAKGVSAVGKAAGGVAKSAVSVARYVPGVSILNAEIGLAGDILKGKNVIKSARNRGKGVVSDVRKALPVAASAVAFVPGVGQGIGAGLNAASALSAGKSLRDVAIAAAAGSVPGGAIALQGVNLASDIVQGKNVISSVTNRGLSYVRDNIPGGQLGTTAFDAARDIAKGKNVISSVTNRGLSYVQSNIPGGQIGQSAFQVARNVAAGKNVIQSVATSGADLVRQNLPQVPTMNFANAIRPAFGLPAAAAPQFVGRVRSVAGMTRPQLRPMVVGKAAAATMRPLTSGTRSWLTAVLPRMRGEVAGLTETGTQWRVEPGDTGSSIAKALTGNPNRWTELRAPNPKVMGRGAAAIKKYGFPIYVGDILNLPSSWIKVSQAVKTSSVPVPVVAVAPQGDLAAQRQARTILVAWSKSDGANQAGVSDYGSSVELGATGWSARDTLAGASFASWWSRSGGSPTVTSGDWSDTLARALNAWAERKAQGLMSAAIAQSSPVVVTQPTAAAPVRVVPASVASVPSALPQPVTTPTLLAGAPAVQTSVSAPASTTSAQAPAAATPEQPNTSRAWAIGSIVASTIGAALIRAI